MNGIPLTQQLVYVYDPINNITERTSMADLIGMSGHSAQSIRSLIENERMSRRIGHYFLTEKPKVSQKRKWMADLEIDDEVWLPIDGHVGWHISNYARVRRKDDSFYKGYEYRLPEVSNGGKRVKLSVANRRVPYSVPRLVMATFVGPLPSGCLVRHKNGITYDDNLGNLEYAPRRLVVTSRGRSKRVVKYCRSNNSVVSIYDSINDAAEKEYYSRVTLSRWCRGKRQQPEDVACWFSYEADYEAVNGKINVDL